MAVIDLAGNLGTVTWEKSVNGGAAWFPAIGTASQTSLTVSNLAQTTIYRAAVKSGVCNNTYSTIAVIDVIPPYPPSPVTTSPSTICDGQSSILTAATGYPTQIIDAQSGGFDQGTAYGWVVDGSPNQSAGGNNTDVPYWQKVNNHPFLGGIVWDSKQGKFNIVNGANNSVLISPAFNLIGQANATLSFIQAFILEAGAFATIDISTDNFATFSNLATYTGPLNFANPTAFQSVNLDLSSYLGQSNLKIRFNFHGTTNSTWALDALSTPGTALPTNYVWSGTGLSGTTGVPVTATPPGPGTYTYVINTTVGGCPGGSQNVTVTVNAVASINPASTVSPLCASAMSQTISLPYSSPTNSPSIYSIDWNAGNLTVLTAVSGASLAANSISINIPANAASGTYNGNVSVQNSFGCGKTGNPFSFVINPRPALALSGTLSICNGSATTLTFNVPAAGYSGTLLANGVGAPISLTASGSTLTVTVSPSVNTTYTLASLSNGTCNSIPSDLTGSYLVNVVDQPVVNAQPAPSTICVGSDAVISGLVVSGVISSYFWEVSTDNGSSWVNTIDGTQYAGSTTGSLTVKATTIGMVDYLYRLNIISGAPCNKTLQTPSVKLKLKNVWTGGLSIDWMTGSNWSDGAPPTLACDNTYILGGRSFQPTLSYGTGTVNNLIIQPAAYTTVNSAGILGIAGNITNAGTLDLLAGTLLLNGTTANPATASPQSIDGTVFKSKTIYRLTLNNNVNVVGNDTLKISHTLGFDVAANGKTFTATTATTSGNVSLLSSFNYTANVNEIKNGNSILGNNFTVERYIGTGTVHGQTWQLLSTAITGQTIKNSWQESGVYKPGLGTRITSPLYTTGNGFDAYSQRDAMKVYNPNNNVYDGVTSTLNNLANPTGYYLFVRGDRNILTGSDSPKPTNLRSTGTLNTGNGLPFVLVQAAKFASVGNPYPSTIDLRKLYNDHLSFLTFDVYIWDPTLGGAYGVGGFRTLTYKSGDYNAVPAGGFYNTISNFIQSGQAFFVRSSGNAGNINFNESYKKDTSNLASRTQFDSQIPIIQTTLSGATAGTTKVLLDGALAIFGDEYSNEVNFDDANKFINVGVNTGFVRSGKILAVERRQLPTATDTMHLNFSGAKQLSYTWSINMENLDGLGIKAWLLDKFLNTTSPLVISGNTDIDFVVDNNAASTSSDRFKIVFTKVVLPVKFSGIAAVRNTDKTISVSWKVENEIDVIGYTVERSADGITYQSLSGKAPLNNNGAKAEYTYSDANPLFTDNYYRIKVLSQDGRIQYSTIVRVEALKLPSSISVYPNPVINKEMSLVFVNKAMGTYDIQITDNLGQVVYNGQVFITSVITNKKISLVDLKAAGIYQLTIKAQDGSTNNQRQILLK